MKVIAVIFLIVFLWYAVPYFRHGEWFAPTAIAPGTWMEQMTTPGYRDLLATPKEGYGIYHFDFWNDPSPYGRPVTRIRY